MIQKNREFKTITNSNTIAQWVDAYNNNALAASDIVYAMGEATFSSVLYTGLETVGNGKNAYKIEAFKDVAPDFKAVFPDNLVLDNWYCYFRNINRFLLISDLHVDLTDYSKYENDEYVQGDLYHFFLNYQLGYRISHSPIPKEGETRLFRFIAQNSTIMQLIPTFPRYFYAGNNVDYMDITGMDVKPSSAVTLGLNDGFVDYDGITFDFHPVPDKKYYTDNAIEGFSIENAGAGYLVDDIIATNEPTTNFLVTEVADEYTIQNLWNDVESYYQGSRVVVNNIWWESLINNNINNNPEITANICWKKLGAAGRIIAGKLSEDPINIQGGGTGAKIYIGLIPAQWSLLYNTKDNKLDYTNVTQIVDGTKVMDYTNNTQKDLAPNKFTIQRIHLDYLKDYLVIQYGNQEFDTMREALDAVYSLSFPFVYNTYIFPVLAYMIVRSDYTDLNDPEQCQIVQIHTHSTDIRDSENLATDSYARSILAQHTKQIQALNDWLTRLQKQTDDLEAEFDAHISNNLPTPTAIKSGNNQNPHRVTKSEVGLGNVDNISLKDMLVPTTQQVTDYKNNNDGKPGPEKTLVHVREAIDECLQNSKNYTNDVRKNLRSDIDRDFLRRNKNDFIEGDVTTLFDKIGTKNHWIRFATTRAADGTFQKVGYNWYVGYLEPNPPVQSYGVEKSQ